MMIPLIPLDILAMALIELVQVIKSTSGGTCDGAIDANTIGLVNSTSMTLKDCKRSAQIKILKYY